MTAASAPTIFAPTHPRSSIHSTLLNLLIVDGDRSVREACREAAITLGFHTPTSESAEQAFWSIESQIIDVVLLDLKLGGSERVDILRDIKRRRPDIDIIVVTACHRRLGGRGHEEWSLRLPGQAFRHAGTEAPSAKG